MANKNIITFKTLDVHFDYKKEMLKNEKDVKTVHNAVHYLVHKEEKAQATKKMTTILEKLEESLGSTDVLTADEKASYENYTEHLTFLDKLIEKTGFTDEKWEKMNEVDKVFLQLIALPNIPKTFGTQVSIISKIQLTTMLDLAEKYFSEENASCKDMQNQLAYDLFFAKKGGKIFNGIKLKPNATDTKKFLALFITDMKLNANHKYDFAPIWNDSKKMERMQLTINKFLAMYINNRMDLLDVNENTPAKKKAPAEETQ